MIHTTISRPWPCLPVRLPQAVLSTSMATRTADLRTACQGSLDTVTYGGPPPEQRKHKRMEAPSCACRLQVGSVPCHATAQSVPSRSPQFSRRAGDAGAMSIRRLCAGPKDCMIAFEAGTGTPLGTRAVKFQHNRAGSYIRMAASDAGFCCRFEVSHGCHAAVPSISWHC